jgi:uncharacterized protein YvpB
MMFMKKILIIIIMLLVSVLIGDNTLAANSGTAQAPPSRKGNDLSVKDTALQKREPIIPESFQLDVPLINQMDEPQLYNGCEVTSLAMLLNYNGIKVTKNELADKIPKVPLNYSNGLNGNPNVGFVGDMENGPGLSVYNGPIYDLAKEYVGDRAVNLTNSPFTDLLKQVSQGHPVWIITTTTFSPVSDLQEWNTPQGKVEITYSGHSVVITGYDDQYIYINDPYGYKNRKVDRADFIQAWEQMGSQAIVIE